MRSLLLNKQDWQKTFDEISKAKPGRRVTIEISSAGLGVQKEAEDAGFLGISYDPKGHTVAINTDGLEHMIGDPSKIEIAHSDAELNCIEITDKDDLHHLIYFTPPLSLPSLPRGS